MFHKGMQLHGECVAKCVTVIVCLCVILLSEGLADSNQAHKRSPQFVPRATQKSVYVAVVENIGEGWVGSCCR